jgi:CheY-like chemotaxis protein
MQTDGDASSPAGLRVIIVEDEALVIMLLEDMLTGLGCRIAGVASHIEEAMKLAGSADADLAIVDLNLDGRDAYVVAERFVARGIPFILATGYDPIGIRAGFCDRPTLQKPFRVDDLSRAIAEATSSAASDVP